MVCCFSGLFFLTSKITYCSSSFSPCLPFNLSSCTTENVGRLVTPAKKLEDTIRLAELVIEVLQQNEEHHAEVSSVPSEVVSPQVFFRIRWELCMFVWCLPSWSWVIFFKSWKHARVRWREGTLQEECVFRGEGGLKDELIELCSPQCQSAAFLTVPAGAESAQNIHHDLPARARLSTLQKGCISNSWPVCVPPASMSGVPAAAAAPAVRRGARKTATKQNNSPFCPFLRIQVVSRGLPGPLQYVINSFGFLLASSALAYWEYLNYWSQRLGWTVLCYSLSGLSKA